MNRAAAGSRLRAVTDAKISNVDASKITGGVLDTNRIPNLDAGKITSGTLADARLSTNVSLLGSSIESSEITDGTIVNVDINVSAAIADTKLGTIATAGKVADTALSTNVAFLNRSSPTFTGTNVFSGRVSIGSGGTTLTSVICASATLDFGSR